MSWESNTVLEGIFDFGGPINIWQAQIWSGGQMADGQGVSHVNMQIDDNDDLANRIDQKIRSEEGIYYFPRLIFMQNRSTGSGYWKEWVFSRPWLHGLHRDHKMSGYPWDVWKGWTLGICFVNSAANTNAALSLFRNLKDGTIYGISDKK